MVTTTAQADSVATAWRFKARELAAFVAACMVNRRDRFGHYISPGRRPKRQRKDGTIKEDTAFTANGLTDAHILHHFIGENQGNIIGLHSTSAENTCRWGSVDVDAHDEGDDAAKNFADALAIKAELEQMGFTVLLEDSNGDGGFHITVIFTDPAPAAKVYSLLRRIKRKLSLKVETFPKQSGVTDCGNWLRLPGRHHTRDHYSRFYGEGGWLEGTEAIEHFISTPHNDPHLLPEAEPDDDRADPGGPFAKTARAAAEWRNAGAEGWAGRYSDRDLALQIMAKMPNQDVHYDTWLEVGMALKSVEDSAKMLEAWEEWSSRSNKHCDGVCAEKWRSFTRTGGEVVTIATLTYLAKQAGVKIEYFPPRRVNGHGKTGTSTPPPAERAAEVPADDMPPDPEPAATTARPRTAPKSEEPDTRPDPMEDTRPPIPLDSPPTPPLDEAAIGYGWFGDMVRAVATATETPPEMALCFGLGSLSTALAKKVVVRVEGDHTEPAILWLAPAMASGNRKTSVMNAMTGAIVSAELEELRRLEPEIKRVEGERKTIEARIAHLRQKAAHAASEEFEARAAEVREMEEKLPEVPRPRRLFTQDCTPEHLGTMLSQNGERMAILSDEGGLFDSMGRYSNGVPNLDLYLQSHTGRSPVRVDRGSRPPVNLAAPALTLAFSPQPEILQGLAEMKGFRGRGLLARFFFMLPPSRLGFRTLEPNPVPPAISGEYERRVRELLDWAPADAGTPDEHPHTVQLDSAAHRYFKSFQRTIEKRMRPDQDLHVISDWASKLPGGVARIALLLHCAEYAGAEPHHHDLSSQAMAQAILLAKVFISHALAAFDFMGADPAMETARKALKWINKERVGQFSERDCWHPHRGSVKRVEDMRKGLELLVSTGHIFPIDNQLIPGKRGRKPGQSYTVNPHLVSTWGELE